MFFVVSVVVPKFDAEEAVSCVEFAVMSKNIKVGASQEQSNLKQVQITQRFAMNKRQSATSDNACAETNKPNVSQQETRKPLGVAHPTFV